MYPLPHQLDKVADCLLTRPVEWMNENVLINANSVPLGPREDRFEWAQYQWTVLLNPRIRALAISGCVHSSSTSRQIKTHEHLFRCLLYIINLHASALMLTRSKWKSRVGVRDRQGHYMKFNPGVSNPLRKPHWTLIEERISDRTLEWREGETGVILK